MWYPSLKECRLLYITNYQSLFFLVVGWKVWTVRRELFYLNIYERNTRSIITIRFLLVHECMLAPITHHHASTHQQQRHQEHKNCRPSVRIHFTQRIDEPVISKLPERAPRRVGVFSLAQKIERQVQPDEKEEPPHVMREMWN